jgi:hypothetical protein
VARDGQQRKQEARERARIRREEERRKARQRQIYLYAGSFVAIAAVIIGIVFIALNNKGSSDTNINLAATPSITTALGSIPAANYDTVGKGTSSGGVQPVTGQPALTANGKPEVLYVGAEYCPYCAAERWAMVTALSRFGTFSGLETTASSSKDVFPSTATLSFLHATYTSDYITFSTKETQDRAGKKLQALTSAETATFSAIAPKGGIPFFDIANKYFINGAQYDPGVLKGLTAEQIATQAGNPSTDVGKAVLGSANLITAAICKATNNQPTAVCTSSAVTSVASGLTGGSAGGSS